MTTAIPALLNSSGSNTRSCSRRWPGYPGARLAAAVTPPAAWVSSAAATATPNGCSREIGQVGGARVGVRVHHLEPGHDPGLLDMVLAQRPATIMLSFGELAPFAERIRAAGVPLTAQVQNLDQARQALDAARTSSWRRAARRAGTE